mmetsp:Transcript_4328/g.18291  ORF Transcript_4328/g.18291 Transcript_4328/m.18291 type:complete len:423 (-) Transcript_4328:365-1633(-)
MRSPGAGASGGATAVRRPARGPKVGLEHHCWQAEAFRRTLLLLLRLLLRRHLSLRSRLGRTQLPAAVPRASRRSVCLRPTWCRVALAAAHANGVPSSLSTRRLRRFTLPCFPGRRRCLCGGGRLMLEAQLHLHLRAAGAPLSPVACQGGAAAGRLVARKHATRRNAHGRSLAVPLSVGITFAREQIVLRPLCVGRRQHSREPHLGAGSPVGRGSHRSCVRAGSGKSSSCRAASVVHHKGLPPPLIAVASSRHHAGAHGGGKAVRNRGSDSAARRHMPRLAGLHRGGSRFVPVGDQPQAALISTQRVLPARGIQVVQVWPLAGHCVKQSRCPLVACAPPACAATAADGSSGAARGGGGVCCVRPPVCRVARSRARADRNPFASKGCRRSGSSGCSGRRPSAPPGPVVPASAAPSPTDGGATGV